MELDLRDYLRILRKYIWLLIVLVVLASVSTGVVSYVFLEPVYEASAKLIVNKRSDLAEQLDINSVNLNLRLIDTYKEIIKTNAIMDKVVAEYPEFKMTSDELIRRIRVSSVNNTQVMTLSLQDSNYDKAVEVVNAVATVFMREIPNIMTVDNVSILNMAKPDASPSPVKPNPLMNIAISIVVSLMVGVGLALLLEYLDDTIKTEQDVQALLDLPTLALIPKMDKAQFESVGQTASKRAGEIKHVTTHHS